MREVVKIGDIMTRRVVTANSEDDIIAIAKKMAENKVGFIVIVNNGKPIGVMSEGDIIRDVLSKDLDPRNVKAKDVYKYPIISISPSGTLFDASRLMARRRIRRLVVVDEGEMVGVISSRDILEYAPYLIEVLIEKLHAERGEEPPRTVDEVLVGECESCGKWSDFLHEKNGRYLCEDCYLTP